MPYRPYAYILQQGATVGVVLHGHFRSAVGFRPKPFSLRQAEAGADAGGRPASGPAQRTQSGDSSGSEEVEAVTVESMAKRPRPETAAERAMWHVRPSLNPRFEPCL